MKKTGKPASGGNGGGNRKQRRVTKAKAKKHSATIHPMPTRNTGKVTLPAILPGQKRVLHVGCGDKQLGSGLHDIFKTKDWVEVRLDIDAAVAPDIQSDMLDMHMIPDNSFDAVWSSHNIEHVWAHQVPQALKEFTRVLKPEGFLLLMTPDMEAVAEAVGKKGLEGTLYVSRSGPITPLDIMYGHGKSLASGYHFMAHKMAFTAGTLGRRFFEAGLADVTVDRTRGSYNLTARGYKRAQTKENTRSTIIQQDPNEMMQARDELDVPPTRKYEFKF